MHAQVKAIMNECTEGSDGERLAFPEVVAKLAAAGVERYRADLVRAEKIYYLPDGESHLTPSHRIDCPPAVAFSADGVRDAVRAIQAGRIRYREFCARILEAGCVDYIVSLAGRRAIYFGRTGESTVEMFPPAP